MVGGEERFDRDGRAPELIFTSEFAAPGEHFGAVHELSVKKKDGIKRCS